MDAGATAAMEDLPQDALDMLRRLAVMGATPVAPEWMSPKAAPGFLTWPPDSLLRALNSAGAVVVSEDGLSLGPGWRRRVLGALAHGERRALRQAALYFVNGLAPLQSDDSSTWPLYTRLRPHIVEVLRSAEEEGFGNPTGLLMGEKFGVYVYLQGESALAEGLFRRALEIDEACLGADAVAVAVDLSNLAFLLESSARLDEAEPLRVRATAILMSHESDEPEKFAIALGNLARFLAAKGVDAGVEDLRRRAVGAVERARGPEAPCLALHLRNLAGTLLDAGRQRGVRRNPEAEILLRRALAIDERALGSHHPAVAEDLRMLTFVLDPRDAAPEIEDSLRRALDALRGTAPGNRNLSRSIRSDLIALCEEQGRPADARALRVDEREEQLREALDQSPGNPSLLSLYGVFLKNERGDADGAERCHRMALRSAPDDATAHGNLALLLSSALGRPDEGEEHYRRSVELEPGNATLLSNYAFFVQNVRRRVEEARALYEMAIAADPADANTRSNLASLLIGCGEVSRALVELAQAWKCQRDRGDRTSARILFQRALLARLGGEDDRLFLGQIRTLFEQGIGHAPWCADTLMEFVATRLDGESLRLFLAIKRVIDDRDAVPGLSGLPSWRAIHAVDLGAEWPVVSL